MAGRAGKMGSTGEEVFGAYLSALLPWRKLVTDGVVLVNIYARCLRVIRLGQCDPSSKLPKLRLIPRSPTGRRLISIAYVGRRAGYRELDTGVEYCDRFVPRHGEDNGCCSLSKSTGRPT